MRRTAFGGEVSRNDVGMVGGWEMGKRMMRRAMSLSTAFCTVMTFKTMLMFHT